MTITATIGKRNKLYRLVLSSGVTFLCADFKIFSAFLKQSNRSRRDGVYVKTVGTLTVA